ncbi:MAG: response regulator transcription factor [Oscillospiraceae bacterium]|nr:response regulator transcription factor [Oscillospiraceae bacterium]
MASKIYLIEDDENIRTLLLAAMRASGFEPRAFESAPPALAAMRDDPPDAAVFDIMLEGTDGIEALRQVRADPALCGLPVMMLTAKDTELDKVTGLDAGADDYMTKPFSVLELCARVRALLRRGGAGQQQTVYTCGGLRLDEDLHEATLDGRTLELTLKEFELLRELMRQKGRTVPREELLQRVWGYAYLGETRTLDMHIGTLRHKLGDDAENSRYIKTVRGVGYRFVVNKGEAPQ